ncbi:uncharacterized protein PAC_11745 [Phialocephala subalpina]|uniref:Uncharacterized protein n=1 Tax=Phialocephala subalpina TaxID=576137 RepID=A0A1L7X9X6_9HELO|nr:uncharacterized protein PAC_11745 [Phialocephala subalpina]
MISPIVLLSVLLLSIFSSLVTSTCTTSQRLAIAAQIPAAYNLSPLGASYAAFEAIPFAPLCQTSIAPNGLPPVPVAIDRSTTELFAQATRQLFSEVTGCYVDFPRNGTTDIQTNVTLGVRDIIPIPVTFSANVYLDFGVDLHGNCQINAVRAFATIPSQVLGLILTGSPLDLSGVIGSLGL